MSEEDDDSSLPDGDEPYTSEEDVSEIGDEWIGHRGKRLRGASTSTVVRVKLRMSSVMKRNEMTQNSSRSCQTSSKTQADAATTTHTIVDNSHRKGDNRGNDKDNSQGRKKRNEGAVFFEHKTTTRLGDDMGVEVKDLSSLSVSAGNPSNHRTNRHDDCEHRKPLWGDSTSTSVRTSMRCDDSLVEEASMTRNVGDKVENGNETTLFVERETSTDSIPGSFYDHTTFDDMELDDLLSISSGDEPDQQLEEFSEDKDRRPCDDQKGIWRNGASTSVQTSVTFRLNASTDIEPGQETGTSRSPRKVNSGREGVNTGGNVVGSPPNNLRGLWTITETGVGHGRICLELKQLVRHVLRGSLEVQSHTVLLGGCIGWYATMAGTKFSVTNYSGIGENMNFNAGLDQEGTDWQMWDKEQDNWGTVLCGQQWVRVFRTKKAAEANLLVLLMWEYGQNYLEQMFEGGNQWQNSRPYRIMDICSIGYKENGGGYGKKYCTVTKKSGRLKIVRR